jgi:putative transposase
MLASLRATVGDSWRVDETYLKVGGQWMYLYRAVDKQRNTVESYLSRTRDVTAAKAFFRKALKRHDEPRVITLDGFEPSHAALRRMGMNNEFNYVRTIPSRFEIVPT